MSFDNLQQNFANATGFVYDRTINPPKMLGQCFIVSKSRAVTTANNIYNYAEAPWALVIEFPHPDVILGVKAISVHNEFDRREARNYYLSQTGSPLDVPPVLLNDLATITLDATLSEVPPDRVAELNRALSLPFDNQGVEASGNIEGAELDPVIKTILGSGRGGLLTLFDYRNIPLGRVQFQPGQIQKVHYKAMVGEMAFAELDYRKPAHGYAFQPEGVFNWGGLRDITVPTDQLIAEAKRRTSQIEPLFGYLAAAGSQARFQKTVQSFDPNSTSEQIRWFVELLWTALDGYITVDRLPERLGVDTYTILVALRELVNRGVVSLLNRATPFHCGGQLGTPLISHTDFDINPGDPLSAFYLDPLSGAPTWQQGTFFGVSSVLQPKNLLHTIGILPGASGALILKNYRLVGVHGGALAPKPGQDQRLYQMMWIGALLDMSAKKLRSATEGSDEEGDGIAGLKTRLQSETTGDAERLEKLTCPNCHSTNTKVGPCFNCGTEIVAPEPEVIPENKVELAVYKAKKLQEKYNISNKHLAMVGAIVLLPLVMMSMCGSPTPTSTTTTTTSTTQPHANDEKAAGLAVEFAGFKSSTPPGYWYEDTSTITAPLPSFGMMSERANQRVIFMVHDDMAPVNNLENFIGRPPFAEVNPADKPDTIKIDQAERDFGTGKLKYFVGRYLTPKGNDRLVLTGAYPSPREGKSILVVGTSLNDSVIYDPGSTLWLIDHMGEEYTARGNRDRLSKAGGTGTTTTTGDNAATGEFASDEDVKSYLAGVEEKIQSKLELPGEVEDELKKKKSKKLKVTVQAVVNEAGQLTKINISEASEVEAVSNAVVNAVNSAAPFEDTPKTKDGKVSFKVRLNMDKVTVEKM